MINDIRVTAVEIVDCGEKLVDLSDYLLFTVPSQVKGIENTDTWTDPEFTKVRKSVAEKLKRAHEILQELIPGDKFAFTETLRSYQTQKDIYNKELVTVMAKNPGLELGECETLVSGYISNPDVYSPHTTGGAVDLTIVDNLDVRLDMGIRPGYGPWDRSDYQDLTDEQRTNRVLLKKIMSEVGFVNYPLEWWHWSYGDKYWGYVTGNKSIYGPMKTS